MRKGQAINADAPPPPWIPTPQTDEKQNALIAALGSHLISHEEALLEMILLARKLEQAALPEVAAIVGPLETLALLVESQFPAKLPPADYQFEFNFAVTLDFRDWRTVTQSLRSPLAAPAAWVATKGDKVLHLAKADGWRVEVVQTEPQRSET